MPKNNEFTLTLERAKNSDNPMLHRIVGKIENLRTLYNAISMSMSVLSGASEYGMDNPLVGYDRGLNGEEGFTPIKYDISINQNLIKKQEILIKITAYYELIEEILE